MIRRLLNWLQRDPHKEDKAVANKALREAVERRQRMHDAWDRAGIAGPDNVSRQAKRFTSHEVNQAEVNNILKPVPEETYVRPCDLASQIRRQ